MQEVSRERLRVEEGNFLYVEPLVAEPNAAGDVLLAGRYNYLFRQNDSSWTHLPSDSVFGAIRMRDGKAWTVPSPIPTRRLNGIRAAARPDGSWAVVFAETPEPTGDIRPDTAARLWYGVLRGMRWTALERIPLPSGGVVLPTTASRLVVRGDTATWAATMTETGQMPSIVIWQRRGDIWSHERVQTYHAQTFVAPTDSNGLLLGVVQAEPNVRSFNVNSLILWARDPAWRTLRTMVSGVRGHVYHPEVATGPGVSILTWQAAVPESEGTVRMQARAMMGSVLERNESVVVIDSALASSSQVRYLGTRGSTHLWVTDHVFPDSARHEVRFTGVSNGTVMRVGGIDSPYHGWFAAAPIGNSAVLTTGATLEANRGAVFTTFVLFHIGCSRSGT